MAVVKDVRHQNIDIHFSSQSFFRFSINRLLILTEPFLMKACSRYAVVEGEFGAPGMLLYPPLIRLFLPIFSYLHCVVVCLIGFLVLIEQLFSGCRCILI